MADFVKLNGYFVKDARGRELINTESSTRLNQFSSLQNQINSLVSGGLVPYAVDSIQNMVNKQRIYVLKSSGNWYYYNNDTQAWTIGGQYQASDDAQTLSAIARSSNAKKIDLTSLTWVHGGVVQNTHALSTGTDRIRNKTFIRVKAGSVVNFSGYPDGYTFKIVMYKHPQLLAPQGFIVEPIHLGTSAESVTVPVDGYMVVVIHKEDNTPIDTENISTVSQYVSQSEVYEAPEVIDHEDFENIAAKIDTYANFEYGTAGNFYGASGITAYAPIPVTETSLVSHFTTDTWASVKNKMVMVDADGNPTDESLATYAVDTTGGNGYFAPAGTRFCLISCKTVNAPYSVIREMKVANRKMPIRLVRDTPECKLIAHRGLEYYAPEATIPAYTIAGEKGMWGCKLDVRETADGKFVLSHDGNIDRMFNGTGNIASMTLAQLQTYTVDTGNNIDLYPNEKIVTLEEGLDICKRYNMVAWIDFKSSLDTKSKASYARVIDIINKHGMINNCVFQQTDGTRVEMAYVRELNNDIPIMFWKDNLPAPSALYHIPLALTNASCLSNGFDSDWDSQETADAYHALNLPYGIAVLESDTAINDAKKAIKNYGAEIIVTDRVTPEDLAPKVYSV